MDDALSQSVVVGVADGSDREIDICLGQAFGMLDRQVLRSAVRVVDKVYVILRFYLPNSLPQRVEDKLCLQRCRGASACDPPCKDVDHEGNADRS
jgi:hypothetical protein